MRLRPTRHTWVLLHRWAGLFMALFLVVAGLTGSVIAFQEELDAWLNPNVLRTQSSGPMLDPLVLREQVEASLGGRAVITYAPLEQEAGHSTHFYLSPRTDPATGQPYAIGFDELFVDPVSGDVLGARQWGALKLDRLHLIPMLYRLHYSLALPEPWGMWLFGAAALVWCFDCFVGFYLTLPRRRQTFLKAWSPAWKIKCRAAFTRVNLDLHRALSLWVWGMLLVLALSSVQFNLHREVYMPVVKTLMNYETVWDAPELAAPRETPRLDYAAARERGRALMAAWAAEDGFSVEKEQSLQWRPDTGQFIYRVYSSRDLPESFASTMVAFDERGLLQKRQQPYLDGGNILSSWLAALHMGKLWGMWYQIIVALLGLVVATVSITGVLIWWKKRRARILSRRKNAAVTTSTRIMEPSRRAA